MNKKKKAPAKKATVAKQQKSLAATKTDPALVLRNRIALAYMELSRDKIFAKLPEDEKIKLIRQVIRIGDELAEQIAQEYATRDSRKIAAAMGLKILGEERGLQTKPAEYRRHKKEIIVYRKFHERLLHEVQDPYLAEHLLKFIVAHQLFSHLEYERIGKIYKRFKFFGFKLGPYVREHYIPALSRVAAQAFTQTLLQLEISPPVFDYLAYMLYTTKT